MNINITPSFCLCFALRPLGIAEYTLGICLFFALILIPVPTNPQDLKDQPQSRIPFRISFSEKLFSEVNESDGRAAVKAWANAVAHESDIEVIPDTFMFHSVEEMNQALEGSMIDAITVLLPEFYRVNRDAISGPYLRSEINGSSWEQYVLLIRSESNIEKLTDLQGCSIQLYDHSFLSMAEPWLEIILYREGFRTMKDVFREIRYTKKLSKVILDVFFGKCESCLVTLNNFSTMKELNPQIGKQLRVFATSPPVFPTIFFFRKNMEPSIKQKIIELILSLHQTSGGKQVLELFKADLMVEVSEEDLRSSLDLLAELDHLRISGGMGVK